MKAIISPDNVVQAVGDVDIYPDGVLCGGCFFPNEFLVVDANGACLGDTWDGQVFFRNDHIRTTCNFRKIRKWLNLSGSVNPK